MINLLRIFLLHNFNNLMQVRVECGTHLMSSHKHKYRSWSTSLSSAQVNEESSSSKLHSATRVLIFISWPWKNHRKIPSAENLLADLNV